MSKNKYPAWLNALTDKLEAAAARKDFLVLHQISGELAAAAEKRKHWPLVREARRLQGWYLQQHDQQQRGACK